MSRIRIKNFGPIKEGLHTNEGWLDIKKVTLFIGNQGSGKSTIAKLISTFTWIEKALVRGDLDKKLIERKNKLKNQYLNYHRLENYFKSNGIKTVIEYEGEAYHLKYENDTLLIKANDTTNYPLPQIMYVPAERNFITYVKTPKELKLSSESLKEFLAEFEKAKEQLKGLLKLPINNTELEYDKLNDTLNLKGSDYRIKLTEGSSGFQSLVPLFLVSLHLANSVKDQTSTNKASLMMSNEESERFKKGIQVIWDNETLSEEQKRIAISALSSKFNKSAFINIVEELEQNLFPSSQMELLFSLLALNNLNEGNKLIITTHSPYLINFLTLAVKAKEVANKAKMIPTNPQLIAQLESVVPPSSQINSNDWVVYELDEKTGTITQLANYNGLPSDNNYLNNGMDVSNQLFAKLLEIEDICQ